MSSDSFDNLIASVHHEPTNRGRVITEFWNKEDPLIVEGQVIRGGMFPHQRQWWELPNFIKALIAGYGGGKTYSGAKRVISGCLHNSPAPSAVVSPTFSMARMTTIAAIMDLCQGKESIYGKDFWWKYNAQYHEFTIRFRGREGKILIYSGDRPHSLRGPNLGQAWIDEPFIQEMEVFLQMMARVRHPAARVHEILLSGTPEQLNWGYDVCVGDLKYRYDIGVVTASTRSNLALPADYVGRLEQALSEKAAKAYVEGQFINLNEGMVYYAFDRDKNIRDLQEPPGAELGAGIDFNVNPMGCAVFWRRGDHMHFFDEIELENADTEYMASILTEKYKSRLRNVFPDSTGAARKTAAPGGKSDHTQLRDAGFIIHARHENPKRRDRYNAVNGKLKSRTGDVTLTVSPHCKKLIKYLTMHSFEDMNTDFQKKMTHLLDAFSYPVAYLYPVDKETLSVHRLTGF